MVFVMLHTKKSSVKERALVQLTRLPEDAESRYHLDHI